MLKRVDLVGYNAVHDVVNDTFESGISVLGVAEDGVGYALDEYNSPLLPSALIDEVESIRQQIIDGDISVTDYRTL